jgi:hypothetical protein
VPVPGMPGLAPQAYASSAKSSIHPWESE